MSLDELARAASTDLNAAVRRQVSPERAWAGLRGRLRARRYERVVAGLALVVVTAVGVTLVRDLARTQALPASPPTVDRTARLASDCLFDVTCTDGTYRAALTVPTTFSPAGVLDVSSNTAYELDLTEINDTFALTLLADPAPAQPDGRPLPGAGAGANAQELVAALRARPDLVVSAPTASEIAGRPAVVVDVRAAAGVTPGADCLGVSDGCVALFTTAAAEGGWAGAAGLGTSEVDRIFLLDVPGSGTVAVVVRDRTSGAYAPLVAMAQVKPILASLAFGE